MRTFRFYKDPDTRWYIDLPEWPGSKAELEMVAGADTMLEFMSEDTGKVSLCISENHFIGSDRLNLTRTADELQNGAFYFMPMYSGIEVNIEMWLCDVTKFVFGGFPKTIYVAKTSA